MGFGRVYASGRERKWAGKGFEKPSSPLSLHSQGKKKQHSAVQNDTVQFSFFFWKGSVIGKNPKMGYDKHVPFILRIKPFI
jgi:hypothetical protein